MSLERIHNIALTVSERIEMSSPDGECDREEGRETQVMIL